MAALDVPATALINAVAEELKKNTEVKAPLWYGLVKTGPHAERVPEQKDAWFIRCASLLRTAYKTENPIGVRRLRNKYGGRREHVVSRAHHVKSGGKAIRLALQQLEKAGLMEKQKVGRRISRTGRSLLDKAAARLEKG
ncbi:30S ribosomal protein S19e [Candidatus Micrarchaeota archaeon]|nr:30S ribosomal protein S19e [Candidatus Micrarchaeota archaeon]